MWLIFTWVAPNFLAILANLAIANHAEINQTIRDQALNLANYTLNETMVRLWDPSIDGFYSRFNYTWQPMHDIDEKSTIINFPPSFNTRKNSAIAFFPFG